MASQPDVIVVGGGIIGLSIAWFLAKSKVAVTVLERGEPGREASWAAAGMLAPQGESQAGAFLDLCLKGLDLYPDFADRLRQETGVDVEYRAEGALRVALDDAEAEELQRWYDGQQRAGLPVVWLGPEEARRREPHLSPDVRAAVYIPRDHQVENRRMILALLLAAGRAGARIEAGVEAVGVVVEKGRAVGVETPSGRLKAGAIVNAAGCWAGLLGGVEASLRPPVRPVRGQMFDLAMDPAAPFRCVVFSSRTAYLVPRYDGRLLVGATVEEAGYRKAVTAEGLQGLLARALHIAPVVRDYPFLSAWAGLRPGTPDGLPILGPTPVEGLLLATGHYRNGILLAPITAQIIGDLIVQGESPIDLTPFRIERLNRP